MRMRNAGLSCSVAGCGRPARKRGWCGSHYAQQRRTGRPPEPFQWTWADPTPCLVCGGPPAPELRQFCSSACRVLHRSHDGAVPSRTSCVACGVSIDLTARGRRGQRRKASTKLCSPCRRDYDGHGFTATDLAARDGLDCGICGEPVDMSLSRKDSLMCPSVDHVIPRALGGTHDPSNLQLAHLLCNMVKRDQRGVVASSEAVI